MQTIKLDNFVTMKIDDFQGIKSYGIKSNEGKRQWLSYWELQALYAYASTNEELQLSLEF